MGTVDRRTSSRARWLLALTCWVTAPVLLAGDHGLADEGAQGLSTVVGVGDSVTAARACACPGFVAGLAKARSAGHRTAAAVNLGSSGLTAQALAARARAHHLPRVLESADVVVVTVGANDLLPALGRWQDGRCRPSCSVPEEAGAIRAVSQVVRGVQSLTAGRARIFVTGYWNVFPDGAVGLARFGPGYPAWSDLVTRRFNEQVALVCHEARVRFVDLYGPFKAGGRDDDDHLLAPDGDHPNAAGHAVITQALVEAGAAA